MLWKPGPTDVSWDEGVALFLHLTVQGPFIFSLRLWLPLHLPSQI